MAESIIAMSARELPFPAGGRFELQSAAKCGLVR